MGTHSVHSEMSAQMLKGTLDDKQGCSVPDRRVWQRDVLRGATRSTVRCFVVCLLYSGEYEVLDKCMGLEKN